MTRPSDSSPRAAWRPFDIDANDPHGELVDRSSLDPEQIAEIDALMAALVELRQVEEQLSRASQEFMKLNSTDMRAVHFLMISENRSEVTTPGMLGAHLGLSSGATTKLIDRLEASGHVRRTPHPHDRRSLALTVEPATREAAMSTMGRQQAGRFRAAAALSGEERSTVTRFLLHMAQEISPASQEWAGSRDRGRAGRE